MFAPLRVSRRQFKKVTSALAGGTQFVPVNTAFVEEGKTHVENLTLVLDGRQAYLRTFFLLLLTYILFALGAATRSRLNPRFIFLFLLSSFAVTQGARKLHIVRALQFLDSPEWFLVATDHAFQVSESVDLSYKYLKRPCHKEDKHL
jgi:hypothetical protein